MADLWLKTSTSLQEHGKTGRLADTLGIPVPYAGGLVVFLWHKVLCQQEDGDLSGCSDQQIARWAGWRGDAGEFVGSLVAAGFIDANRAIHNWDVYTKELRAKRERDRAASARRRQNISTNTARLSRNSREDVVKTSRNSLHDVASQELESESEQDKVKSSSLSMVDGAAAADPIVSRSVINATAIDHCISTLTAKGYTRSQVEEALSVTSQRISDGKQIRNLTAYVGTILQQSASEATPEPTDGDEIARRNTLTVPPEWAADHKRRQAAKAEAARIEREARLGGGSCE